MKPKTVVVAVGTRPEATKMAPVYWALDKTDHLETTLLMTGQHREQLRHALEVFRIHDGVNLDLMEERQSLPDLASRMLPAVVGYFDQLRPDYVLVHGDTLTTFCVAWSAFLEGFPTGHVEAGLRSGDLRAPFPEEANRRLTDALVDLCLAPTPGSRQNLLREGRDPESVVVTGQTGVDAVLEAAEAGRVPEGLPSGPFVTITLHRRENWPVLGEIAEGLARVAMAHPEYAFVFPVHLNPVVQEAVRPPLESVENFHLLAPLEYSRMAALLAESALVVTDSGGLQEEGAALGVPVVVVREVTERPEGLSSGILRLAGTDPSDVVEAVSALLQDDALRAEMAASPNPYGDGRAAERVASAVAWRLGLADRPTDWRPGTSRR